MFAVVVYNVRDSGYYVAEQEIVCFKSVNTPVHLQIAQKTEQFSPNQPTETAKYFKAFKRFRTDPCNNVCCLV